MGIVGKVTARSALYWATNACVGARTTTAPRNASVVAIFSSDSVDLPAPVGKLTTAEIPGVRNPCCTASMWLGQRKGRLATSARRLIAQVGASTPGGAGVADKADSPSRSIVDRSNVAR